VRPRARVRLGYVFGRGECIGKAAGLRREPVTVRVKQDLCGRPATLRLNPFDGRSAAEMQRCPRVAQIVRPVVPPCAERFPYYGVEHLVSEVRVQEEVPRLVREYEGIVGEDRR